MFQDVMSEQDRVSLVKVQKELMQDYLARRDQISIEDWMVEKLRQHDLHGDVEGARKFAKSVLSDIDEINRTQERLEKAQAAGMSKESWFAREFAKSARIEGFDAAGERLRTVLDATNNALLACHDTMTLDVREKADFKTFLDAYDADALRDVEWNEHTLKSRAVMLAQRIKLLSIYNNHLAAESHDSLVHAEEQSKLLEQAKEVLQGHVIEKSGDAVESTPLLVKTDLSDDRFLTVEPEKQIVAVCVDLVNKAADGSLSTEDLKQSARDLVAGELGERGAALLDLAEKAALGNLSRTDMVDHAKEIFKEELGARSGVFIDMCAQAALGNMSKESALESMKTLLETELGERGDMLVDLAEKALKGDLSATEVKDRLKDVLTEELGTGAGAVLELCEKAVTGELSVDSAVDCIKTTVSEEFGDKVQICMDLGEKLLNDGLKADDVVGAGKDLLRSEFGEGAVECIDLATNVLKGDVSWQEMVDFARNKLEQALIEDGGKALDIGAELAKIRDKLDIKNGKLIVDLLQNKTGLDVLKTELPAVLSTGCDIWGHSKGSPFVMKGDSLIVSTMGQNAFCRILTIADIVNTGGNMDRALDLLYANALSTVTHTIAAKGSAIGASIGAIFGPAGAVAGGAMGYGVGVVIGKVAEKVLQPAWRAVKNITHSVCKATGSFVSGVVRTGCSIVSSIASGAWSVASSVASGVCNFVSSCFSWL